MEEIHSTNKRIAKNTIYLYFRMMFTMLVALYTSRVVLKVLGVEDYGTYQAVGGIVAVLSFINGALSNGTSRFLTYELGTGNLMKLKKTFSTLLFLHIIIAIIVVVIAETFGLWFVKQKLVIPEERMDAALFAYQMSIIASVISITQVPYNASIISHEKMKIYAYFSIFDTILKLIIVYLLPLFSFDKLKIYALLLCLVHIIIAICYRYYCIIRFDETSSKLFVDKDIAKNVLSYSIWNIISSISIPLKNQGLLIVLNMFFSPMVVTARALANQVNVAANQFILNFRTAANPQIVKKYACGDIKGSKSLLLSSTKYSFYLMLLLCLPIFLLSESLLSLWLINVPEYTVEFLQLAIISSLFQVFDNSFYTALYTIGRIKENALISPVLGILTFPIVFLLFKLGYSPISMAWILMLLYFVLGVVIKPILIVKYAGYEWEEIVMLFKECFYVLLCSAFIPILTKLYIHNIVGNVLLSSVIVLISCIMSTIMSVWSIGLPKELKNQILNKIKYRCFLC